jgi:hypothetical protein
MGSILSGLGCFVLLSRACHSPVAVRIRELACRKHARQVSWGAF